jgi:MSHA biogenesis protein MshM
MYLEHFGLTEYPFSITPDTEFFFSSGVSQEALNTMLVAAKTGEGFIKITGEVGTGKTLLCRKLMSSLGPEFTIAYIPNPYLEPHTLFMELALELGATVEGAGAPNQQQLLKALTNRLLEISLDGKRALVCLDEVQAMPIETLEALRLLTNLETEKRKLLQVIIFGQPELEDKLNHPSIRQLKQRITFNYRLSPMTHDEIDYYVYHRMSVAGYKGGPPFTRLALWMLKRSTNCVPRLINIVAHKSLLAAFGKGHRQVTFMDVRAAVNDTLPSRSKWIVVSGVAALVVAAVAGAIVAYQQQQPSPSSSGDLASASSARPATTSTALVPQAESTAQALASPVSAAPTSTNAAPAVAAAAPSAPATSAASAVAAAPTPAPAQPAPAALVAQEAAAKEDAAAAAQKAATEKAAAEKLAKQRAAEEKAAAEKLAKQKVAEEKAAAEKLAREKAAAEKLAQQKAAEEKAAAFAASPLKKEVEEAFGRWLTLWSSRQAEPYLALFDPSFPNWKVYSDLRRSRIRSAKFIEVTAEKVSFRESKPGEITVRFVQNYRSDIYDSKSTKELVWQKTAAGPKIMAERLIDEKKDPQ